MNCIRYIKLVVDTIEKSSGSQFQRLNLLYKHRVYADALLETPRITEQMKEFLRLVPEEQQLGIKSFGIQIESFNEGGEKKHKFIEGHPLNNFRSFFAYILSLNDDTPESQWQAAYQKLMPSLIIQYTAQVENAGMRADDSQDNIDVKFQLKSALS